MQLNSFVASLVLVALLRDICHFAHGLPPHVPTVPSKTLWERRINASLDLLQTKPCKFLIPNGNCTELRSLPRSAINVYIASAENKGRLSAVLPDKIKLVPTSYDAVLVFDPYPQASFGHPVLVFFIELATRSSNCGGNRRSTYTDDGECITIAQKSRRCTNRLQDRRRKRRCDINFIPTVFMAKEGKPRSQLLQCKSGMAGFGDCPSPLTRHQLSEKCLNSKRCAVTPKPVRQRFCTQTCDYAVLVSGGWNAITATSRTAESVRSMWWYLRRNGFRHENILAFVGSQYSVEIDGNPLTKDSIPTENEFKLRSQINNLCSSFCVDSLVIYLNKPTKSNGGMVVWDENGDGFAEESERYDVKELFDDLRNCRAKQVTVIADHSFSGVLLEKFRSAKRHSSRGTLKNVVIVASANANDYPTYGSFTKSWIKESRSRSGRPRCLRDVIKEVTTTNTRQFQGNFESGSQGLLDRTIYGGSCNKNLHQARRDDMRCQLVERFTRRNRNRG